MSSLPAVPVDLFLNPACARDAAYGDARREILGQPALEAAKAEIRSWPGYAVTPLHSLRSVARQMKVAGVHYKDEGGRFGLGSFKALGGAYAVARLLCQVLGQRLGRQVTTAELMTSPCRELAGELTVTCATDGNHGRSVAWGAQLFGCRCVIYIHATVSEGRRQAIERYGATVVRTAGNYDDSVRQADADAKARGRYVISDTSYEGYMDVPRDVMQGYQLMVRGSGAAAGGGADPCVRPGRRRRPGRGGVRLFLGAAGCGPAARDRGRARSRRLPDAERPQRQDHRRPRRAGHLDGRTGLRRSLVAGLGNPGAGRRCLRGDQGRRSRVHHAPARLPGRGRPGDRGRRIGGGRTGRGHRGGAARAAAGRPRPGREERVAVLRQRARHRPRPVPAAGGSQQRRGPGSQKVAA